MITIKEASEKYYVSGDTVRKWARNGKIKACKVGKIWMVDENYIPKSRESKPERNSNLFLKIPRSKAQEISANIRKIRKYFGMNQKEFCAVTGINHNSLSKAERGISYTRKTREKIRRFLDASRQE